jgi:Spy/CpxP family protein refolding chaperone
MKKRRSLGIVKLWVILGLLAIFVFSNGCSRWKSQPIEKRAMKIVERISKELELSDSQRTELNQISEDIIKKFKSPESVEKRKEIRKAFMEMIKENSLTKEKLTALHQKQEEGQKEMQEFLMEKFIQFHKMLTPGQRIKLANLIEKVSMRFEE